MASAGASWGEVTPDKIFFYFVIALFYSSFIFFVIPYLFVIPAKAGIFLIMKTEIPAFAGMTVRGAGAGMTVQGEGRFCFGLTTNKPNRHCEELATISGLTTKQSANNENACDGFVPLI